MPQIWEQRSGYISIALALLFILLLCGAAYLVARPFLAPLTWGAILTIATWPVYTRLRQKLGGRRTLAALFMTLALALVLLGPLAIIGTSLTENIISLGERLRASIHESLDPPDFLDDVPFVGETLTERWRELFADGRLTDEARQHLRTAIQWLVGIGAALGTGIAQLALSVFCAFFFYRDGEAAARRLSDVLARVGGERAHHLMTVAHGTLKGVVYGVIGAAMAQAILSALGYWLSGVPAPFLLGIATGFFGIIPGGVAIIWIPAAIWLFATEQTLWGVILVLWSAIVVGNIDNVIRPLFVARGGALPLLLVLIGILGGALAFGFIGIFLGPTILAVLYSLMREWSPSDEPHPPADQAAATGDDAGITPGASATAADPANPAAMARANRTDFPRAT